MDAVSHGLRGSTIQFFNIEDVRVARDNFRQTGLDLMQLTTLCAEGDLDLDGDGDKDTNGEVGYFGHSMGAIIGAVFAAVNPRVHSVVLNAPGGGITRIFESEGLKGGIQLLSLPALGLEWGDDAYDEVLPVLMGSTQPIFDPADPLSFASRLGEQRVLIVEGKDDHLVPNTATDALIDAAGLDVPDGAAVDDDGLHVAVRIDLDDFELSPAGDNVDIDAHNTHFALEGVRRITAEFLRSKGTVLLDVAAP
jgi:pimeloyl-ACP methyl ester carboxylesterase